MHNLGYPPDPWQVRVLESPARQMLLNCSRQSGKSTVVAALALIAAVWNRGTQVVLLSRSLRQARLLFDRVVDLFRKFGDRIEAKVKSAELLFAKLVLLLFVIAYAIAFVVGNDKRIPVDFVFTTGRVSLIWAVLLLLLVGLGGGLLLSHLYRHRRSKQSRQA